MIGLVNKLGLDKSLVDYICMGTVIQVYTSFIFKHLYSIIILFNVVYVIFQEPE